MLSALKRFIIPAYTEQANALYLTTVAHARKPLFYEKWHVPDTLDGRFEMIVLHLSLLVHHFTQASDARLQGFSKRLLEIFFDDMDRSLREMGVGDMGVGKRVGKMAEAYYGRLNSYAEALSDEDNQSLRDAITRNVYGTLAKAPDAAPLTDYILNQYHHVKSTPDTDWLASKFSWKE